MKRMRKSILTSYLVCISTPIVTIKMTIFMIANFQLVETIPCEVVCEVGNAHNRVTRLHMLPRGHNTS